MSSLIVDICEIEEIKPHPNADRLELVRVKNWWCVTGIGTYKVSDKVVYFPPDSVVPEAVARMFGIEKYCQPVEGGMRIRATRLRGIPSFGTVQRDEMIDDLPVGTDLVGYYHVKKYEPPVKLMAGEAAPDLPAFHKYTDIENINNYPWVLMEGEEVVITEKIHGTNSRLGRIEGELNAGSHNLRIKHNPDSKYWRPLNKNVQDFLKERHVNENVILFGEIFGKGIQDMGYDTPVTYRAFDISINGQYLNYEDFLFVCQSYGIEMVPALYVGPWSVDLLDKFREGQSTIASHFREGIVIKPVKERHSEIGRVILKAISVDYLSRKGGTEDH